MICGGTGLAPMYQVNTYLFVDKYRHYNKLKGMVTEKTRMLLSYTEIKKE